VTDQGHARTAAHRESGWKAGAQHAFALVFLRDWHPVLRDPLDLFRLSFPIGALIYALQGDWDAAIRLLAPGFAVFLVRAIDVPRPVDWVFCAAMFFQGWGNALHLFSKFWWYDNCVHITLPMSLAPILYIGFARLGHTRPRPRNLLFGRFEGSDPATVILKQF